MLDMAMAAAPGVEDDNLTHFVGKNDEMGLPGGIGGVATPRNQEGENGGAFHRGCTSMASGGRDVPQFIAVEWMLPVQPGSGAG